MITNVNQRKFKEALILTERVVSRHASLPILQNVVLKTDQGRLRVSSTNLEIGINCWIGAKTEEEGEIALPARLLTDFISNIEDEKITLQVKDQTLLVNTEWSKAKIVGFSSKDFPIIPRAKDESPILIESGTLLDLLASTTDSTSLSESRPELAGVLLKFSDHKIIGAATDSFRLAEKTIESPSQRSGEFIIPRSTTQEIIRILTVQSGEVAITFSDNQIFFKTNDLEVVSRLIDGRYPDYQKVIPEKFITRVKIDKGELEKQARLAGIFSSSVSDLQLQGEKSGLRLITKNSERGEFNTLLSGEVKGDNFKIALNYRYLLDGLKNIQTKTLWLDFTGEGSPLVLRPEKEDNFLYLIMPLRN